MVFKLPPLRQSLYASLFLAIGLSAPMSYANPKETHQDPRVVAFETGLIDRMKRGQDNPKRWTIEQRLAAHDVPGVAVAIIDNNQVVWSAGYGTKLAGTEQIIDEDTVFSVGSVSKMINAALILRLVAEGKLDLDADVNTYLKSWKVEESPHTTDHKVTLRRILAHTAGFSQHGFADYLPNESLPTPLQTLNGTGPAKNGRVRLMFEPGKMMDYSGGGITVSQQLIEDVTGLAYPDAAQKYVFAPLKMSRSTFVNPLPEDYQNVAKAHDEYGQPTALPRGYEAMPEMAASGLWTSAEDLAKFVLALMNTQHKDDGFLPKPIAQDMMTRVKNSWYGLGPRLNGFGDTRVFHHGGANNSYRAYMEGQINEGKGIVVLTNGTDGHWVHSEIRKAAEDAFGWKVKADGGYEEPTF